MLILQSKELDYLAPIFRVRKVLFHRLELINENEILPRLQNIETCYTSTYDCYAKGIDQLDNMQADINMLKKVVTTHSAKLDNLQKIS